MTEAMSPFRDASKNALLAVPWADAAFRLGCPICSVEQAHRHVMMNTNRTLMFAPRMIDKRLHKSLHCRFTLFYHDPAVNSIPLLPSRALIFRSLLRYSDVHFVSRQLAARRLILKSRDIIALVTRRVVPV